MHSWGCLSSKASRQFGLSLPCLFSGSEGKLGHASFIEIFQQRVGRSPTPTPTPTHPRSNSGNTQKKLQTQPQNWPVHVRTVKTWINRAARWEGRHRGKQKGEKVNLGTIMGLFSQRTALPLIKCAPRFARNPEVYAHTLLPATEQRHVACSYNELNTRFYSSASLQTETLCFFYLFFFFLLESIYVHPKNAGRDKNAFQGNGESREKLTMHRVQPQCH